MKTKSIIAALLLAASSAFAQVPSYVPTNGLVGWWPFNGNANDESGNGNNGTMNGVVSIPNYQNNPNSAFEFGLGRSVSIPMTLQLFQLPQRSISCWFRANGSQTGGRIYETTFMNGGIAMSGTSIDTWYGYSQHCCNIVGTNGGTLNQWHHLVSIANDNTGLTQLFLDGNLIASSNGYPAGNGCFSNTQWQWQGKYLRFGLGASNESFSGDIDDIAIWNRALTQQEITALYNGQSCTGTGAITADGPTTFCAGNYVNLTSDVVGGTYQWKKNGVNISTNGTSRTYKATATGSYTCMATCNGTALTSNAIQVTTQTNAAVTLTASGATSFCAGDSVTLNATNLGSGYSVQWYRTNISMQGATNYSVVVKQPGTYKTVTKNLSNGCSRISSGSITTAVNCRMSNPNIIAVNPMNDEIPATKLGNSTETTMHLFPNPNAGSFTLEYDGIEADFEVQVLNTMGQVIYNDIIPSNDKHLKTSINLGDNMQKGIYVVRIINGENVHESKVMLQ